MEHWVVTGASRGIGLGIVANLAARGDRATACVRHESERAATGARFIDAAVSTLAFDVRCNEEVVAAAGEAHDDVNVLVANAGVFGPKESALSLGLDRALDFFSINTLGPLRTVRAFLPRLVNAENPRVILISSILGSSQATRTSDLAYSASKAALNKIALALAHDLKSQHISVIALEPGWVKTELGGADAPVSIEESASGIIALVDSLTLSQSGQFFDYQGNEISW